MKIELLVVIRSLIFFFNKAYFIPIYSYCDPHDWIMFLFFFHVQVTRFFEDTVFFSFSYSDRRLKFRICKIKSSMAGKKK